MKYRSLGRLGDHYLDIATNDAVSSAFSKACAKLCAVALKRRGVEQRNGDVMAVADALHEKRGA
ncbi:MAG: hypothetical protein ABL897_07975 [Hyphomicrobium sp.]